MHSQTPSLALAQQLHESDSLGGFRSRFYSLAGRIYLYGNSLGVLSREEEQSLLSVLERSS